LDSRTPQEQRDHQDARFFEEIEKVLLQRFRNKEIAKWVFLSFVVILAVFVVAGAGVIIWILARQAEKNIAALITAVGGLLSALIALPMVVAHYLFNAEEDETIVDQLMSMRQNDSVLRMKQHEKQSLEGGKDAEKLKEVEKEFMKI